MLHAPALQMWSKVARTSMNSRATLLYCHVEARHTLAGLNIFQQKLQDGGWQTIREAGLGAGRAQPPSDGGVSSRGLPAYPKIGIQMQAATQILQDKGKLVNSSMLAPLQKLTFIQSSIRPAQGALLQLQRLLKLLPCGLGTSNARLTDHLAPLVCRASERLGQQNTLNTEEGLHVGLLQQSVISDVALSGGHPAQGLMLSSRDPHGARLSRSAQEHQIPAKDCSRSVKAHDVGCKLWRFWGPLAAGYNAMCPHLQDM